MGECGCGATDIMLQFPGPEGIKYGLEVYPSCHYCGTPAGIVLHRLDSNAENGVEEGGFFFDRAPEAEFLGYGPDSFEWALSELSVPVVDPEGLAKALAKYTDLDYVPEVRALALALPGAVRESLRYFNERGAS